MPAGTFNDYRRSSLLTDTFWAFQYEKCEFILRKVSLDGNDPSWCFLSTHSGKRSDARKRFWVLINFLLTLRAAAHTSEPFLLRAWAFTIFLVCVLPSGVVKRFVPFRAYLWFYNPRTRVIWLAGTDQLWNLESSFFSSIFVCAHTKFEWPSRPYAVHSNRSSAPLLKYFIPWRRCIVASIHRPRNLAGYPFSPQFIKKYTDTNSCVLSTFYC